MENAQLIELTADIVAAHVSNNNVAISDVGTLVRRIFDALSGLGQQQEQAVTSKEPKVSVRASVKPDYIACLECGRKQKTLRRHLMTAHGVTPEQYRADFNLSATYPMVAPNYSERRRALAKAVGLGRKKGERAPRSGGKASSPVGSGRRAKNNRP